MAAALPGGPRPRPLHVVVRQRGRAAGQISSATSSAGELRQRLLQERLSLGDDLFGWRPLRRGCLLELGGLRATLRQPRRSGPRRPRPCTGRQRRRGKDDPVVAQDVVGVQLGRLDDLNTREVAERLDRVDVIAVEHDERLASRCRGPSTRHGRPWSSGHRDPRSQRR